MERVTSHPWKLFMLAGVLVSLLAWPGTPQPQAGTGRTNIAGLSINGIPIVPTGSPNQTIAIAGGRVVINEHVSSAGAIVVNGLHVVVDGVVDVVIASAKSGIF